MKIATVIATPEFIVDLFHFPEGTILGDARRVGPFIEVDVMHPDLPECDPASPPPRAMPQYRRQKDGRVLFLGWGLGVRDENA